MWNVLLAALAPPDLSFRRKPESRGGGPGQALREIRCRSLAAQPQSVVCVSLGFCVSLLSNVLVREPVLCSSHSRIASPVIKFFILFFSVALAASTGAGFHAVCCEIINRKTRIADNKPTLKKMRVGMSAPAKTEKYASDAYYSGLKGTTKAIVMSGVPGGQNTERFVSIEFAIAPVANGKPVYDKAIFVRSDHKGEYKIGLIPGTYWIGPKTKALDPVGYSPPDSSFSEEIAVVKEGVFTQIDLSEIRYAP